MTVNYDPEKLRDANYTLGVVCSAFLEKFGEKSKDIIARTCHQRGMAIGKLLEAKLKKKSFENAVHAFVNASKKGDAPAKLISLTSEKAVLQGTACPLGLNNRGRLICETMMAVDQGILERASKKHLTYTVKKTVAEGDDYCEVIFEVVRSDP